MFIIIRFVSFMPICSPNLSGYYYDLLETKKTWEKLSVAYPTSLAFAALSTEISNSASPRHCVL